MQKKFLHYITHYTPLLQTPVTNVAPAASTPPRSSADENPSHFADAREHYFSSFFFVSRKAKQRRCKRRRRRILLVRASRSFHVRMWGSTMQIAEALRKNNFRVHFVSASASSKARDDARKNHNCLDFTRGVNPNDTHDVEAAIEKVNGTIAAVVFDRFTAEEAFSWRVWEILPHAARILDMQDVHSLRRHRERMAKEQQDEHEIVNQSVMNVKQNAADMDICRELSSIYRSDLTLVCSPVEMRILAESGIKKEKLVFAPFFERIDGSREYSASVFRPFNERKDYFVSLGTFNHAPNVDALYYLKKHIWPLIRDRLGTRAVFHAYGANCTSKHQDLHDEKEDFLIKGFYEDLSKTLGEAKVLLSPLRFGAGIKGKIIESWKQGTPVVTTPIGSEGMMPSDSKCRGWGDQFAHRKSLRAPRLNCMKTNLCSWNIRKLDLDWLGKSSTKIKHFPQFLTRLITP